MFSGIIEDLGEIIDITYEKSNVHFKIMSEISREAYIDQSISHNGVCLTVVTQSEDTHVVTAIKETLSKTNLGDLKVGSKVNLERSVLATTRMDGHFVQGHTDTTVKCLLIDHAEGSWYFTFNLPQEYFSLLVPQGSICINGVSLTIAQIGQNSFTVAIIPYTYEHTNFSIIQVGEKVNVEFDILGKYIVRYLENLKMT